MNIFDIGIYSVFIAINARIIYSDILHKIIPNRYLLCLLILLPFWRVVIIGEFSAIGWEQILYFLGGALINIVIIFLLYHYKLWGAGDSKYIYILSLYLPTYKLILLFGNTAIITLLALTLYFFYFYIFKLSFYKDFRKSIFHLVQEDSLAKFSSVFDISKSFITKLNIIIGFLLLYISIRFSRNIMVEYIYLPEIKQYWEKYIDDILYIAIIFFIVFIYLFLLLIRVVFKKIEDTGYSTLILKSLCIYASVGALSTLIFFQYLDNPQETQRILFLIFTIYLLIFIAVIIGKYLVRISFYLNERYAVSLDNLRVGMIIDREQVGHILRGREVLAGDMGYDLSTKVLNDKDIRSLKKTIKYINLCITKNNKEEDYLHTIIIIRTFPYSLYILLGFVISYFFENQIIQFLINLVQDLFIK